MGENLSDRQVTFGTTVYDEDGRELGTVRGFDESGFYVTVEEGIQSLTIEHERTDGRFGEAELMWRCWECGEMREIDRELPSACPSCGARKEDLYYWTED